MRARVLKSFFAMAFAGSTLISCATTSKIETKPDSFTGGTTSTTDALPVVPSPEDDFNCGQVGFCIQFKKSTLRNIVSYEAIVDDGGEFDHPVNALRTDSLQFNIDGKIHSLSTEVEGALSETVHAGILVPVRAQKLSYGNIDLRTMHALAQAKEVRVRLRGPGQEKTGFFQPISSEAIANLIAAP